MVNKRETKTKSIKRSHRTDFLGIFNSDDSALLVLNRLLKKELTDKKSETINYVLYSDLIDSHNKEVAANYKSSEDIACLTHNKYGETTLNKVVKILFDIKNGIYDYSYCPTRKTVESLLAVAFPECTPVAKLESSWKYGIEFNPISRLSRANLRWLGKKLDGGQLLDLVTSLNPSIRSLLVTNPIAIPFLELFIERTPSLEELYLVLPEVDDDDLFLKLAQKKGIDIAIQQRKYQLYKREISSILETYSERVNVRIVQTSEIFVSDWLFVVANIDLERGEFKNYIAANSMEALYAQKCCCQIGGQTNEHLSNLVKDLIDRLQVS